MSSLKKDVEGELPYHKMDSDNDNNNNKDNSSSNNDCISSVCRPKDNINNSNLELDLDCLVLRDDGQDSDLNVNNCTVSRHRTDLVHQRDAIGQDIQTYGATQQVTYRPQCPRGVDSLVSRTVELHQEASTDFMARLLSQRQAEDENTNFPPEMETPTKKTSITSLSTITRHRKPKDDSYRPPTYRMEPRDDQKFNNNLGHKLLVHTVKKTLDGYVYTGESAAVKTMLVSEVVVDTAKQYLSPRYPRYRWVCHCVMVQNRGQCMSVADKFMWDKKLDNFASYTYHSSSQDGRYVCVVVLYGVYKE